MLSSNARAVPPIRWRCCFLLVSTVIGLPATTVLVLLWILAPLVSLPGVEDSLVPITMLSSPLMVMAALLYAWPHPRSRHRGPGRRGGTPAPRGGSGNGAAPWTASN